MVLVTAVLVGCAPASISHDVGVTYESAEPLKLEVLALLPVTSSEGLDAFRTMVRDSLELALVSSHRRISIIGFQESLQRLSDAGLASEYSAMVRDYVETGVVDPRSIRSIAAALEADHLFDARVGYAEAVLTPTVPEAGNIPASSVTQNVRVTARIWSRDRGEIVWKGNAGVEAVGGELTSRGQRFDLGEMLGPACRQLAWTVPYGPGSASSLDTPVGVRDWTSKADRRRWRVLLIEDPERRLYFKSGDMVIWTEFDRGSSLGNLSDEDLQELFLKASGAGGTQS